MQPIVENDNRQRIVDTLKPEWAAFVYNMAQGMNETDAYLAAYPTCGTRESASASARRLLRNARICEAISEIQEDIFEANIWYLKALQRKALNVLEKAIDRGDIQAAQDLLDRTGIVPRRGIEIATGRSNELEEFLQDGD